MKIIKDTSSTYFGVGVVADITNLITKVSSNKSETNLLLNLNFYQATDFDSSSVLSVALTALSDDREVGYLQAVNNPNLENDFYFYRSNTTNYYYAAPFKKNLSKDNSLQIKNSIS